MQYGLAELSLYKLLLWVSPSVQYSSTLQTLHYTIHEIYLESILATSTHMIHSPAILTSPSFLIPLLHLSLSLSLSLSPCLVYRVLLKYPDSIPIKTHPTHPRMLAHQLLAMGWNSALSHQYQYQPSYLMTMKGHNLHIRY